jgi:L-ascorbate metabolism protein UlaG (beta-lactamase superfamily)
MGNRSGTLIFCLAVALTLGGCLSVPSFDEEAWKEHVESTQAQKIYEPHRLPDGTFFNPWDEMDRGGFFRWVLSENPLEELEETVKPAPTVPNDGAYLADDDESFSITWIGHATFAVKMGDAVVLTDPFFTKKAAIVPREVPPAFGPEVIPEGTIVVITHNHYDHMDAGSIKSLAEKCVFLVPLGQKEFLQKKGAMDVREFDWFGSTEVKGVRFTFMPTQHWSRRFGQGANKTLWGAWLMEKGGKRVYYGGDSGYFKGYRELGKNYPGIDVALLPIGAYEPRWFMHYAHLDIEEALRAFEETMAQTLIPTQWGVLTLGDEPSGYPAVQLEKALEGKWSRLRDRVKILPVGGVYEF